MRKNKLYASCFNQQQLDLLIGTLLGDGSLQTFGRNWRYRALHKASDLAYLDHKYELLRDYCGTGPSIRHTSPDIRTGNVYSSCYFNTLTHPVFTSLADNFYKHDAVSNKYIKVLPSEAFLKHTLTPAAIAYWYMDDGALKWKGRSNAMRICTESFTIGFNEVKSCRGFASTPEVALLKRLLVSLYGITTTTINKRLTNGEVRHRIYIPEVTSTQFRELIKPFLLPSMAYKVSDGNRNSLVL